MYKILIEDNKRWKMQYHNFPSLPRAIRMNKRKDDGHTQSTLRGYFNRVSNYLNARKA